MLLFLGNEETLELIEDAKKVNLFITGLNHVWNETENFQASHVSQRFRNTNYKARYSNDIVIAYTHDLSEYAGKALPYLMHLGASGVVIRFDGLFDPYLLAHEVGHVLGAGHQEDPNGLYSLHSLVVSLIRIFVFRSTVSPCWILILCQRLEIYTY